MSHSPSLNSGVSVLGALSPIGDSRSRSRSPSQKCSPSHGIRSASPNPRRLNETRKKQTSFESNMLVASQPLFDDPKSDLSEVVNNKYENASDNGSEISDEGYRSLGLIQNGAVNKRASVHSQASNEDAENSGKHY